MVEYNKCRENGCGKDVKSPFWYCFPHNQARKAAKEASGESQPKIVTETVEEHRQVSGYSSEGPEFGLACNLALRYTLEAGGYHPDTFESIYRKHVKFFWLTNKELRKELVK